MMEFTMTEQNQSGPGLGPDAVRAEDIFRRFPAITADEAQHAIRFLKKGRHLDVGRVTGVPELRGNIDAFRQEHRKALAVGFADQLKFTLGFVLLLGAVYWLLAR